MGKSTISMAIFNSYVSANGSHHWGPIRRMKIQCPGRRVGGAAPHQGSQHRGGRPCGEQIRPPGPNVFDPWGFRGLGTTPKKLGRCEISPRKLMKIGDVPKQNGDELGFHGKKTRERSGFQWISHDFSTKLD